MRYQKIKKKKAVSEPNNAETLTNRFFQANNNNNKSYVLILLKVQL